jgi:hypothetical protein
LTKSFNEMSEADRIADRIAKNRRIENRVTDGSAGFSLDGIIARLDERRQRATYRAVATLVGVLPIGLMSRRTKSYRDSWVVNERSGAPTGYTVNQIHPDCYRQICKGEGGVIHSPEDLRRWILGTAA